VKFALTVSQNDAVKKLADFANNNKETQGKFTIGDEKVSQQSNNSLFKIDHKVETQCLYASRCKLSPALFGMHNLLGY
jgi:hypothetical protein